MRCISPRTIWPYRTVEWTEKNEEYALSVPCGKCLACLSNKREEWIFRLEQEFKYSKSALFVTLTYNDWHLPGDRSLRKRDVQLYMKRLRKKDGTNKIRYFAVGEYGEISGRPHYHLLLFNCLEEHVRSCWVDSKDKAIGIVHVGKVTQASIAYCTKYIIQKPDFDELERLRPFTLMSRAYGIGGRYLSEEMVKWHRNTDALYCVQDGFKTRMSRFYRSKVWYGEVERERIGRVGLSASLQSSVKESAVFQRKFGELAEQKRKELRDAFLSRIKTKVAFTQTL